MLRILARFFSALAVIMIFTNVAAAQTKLGEYGKNKDWAAFSHTKGGSKICFAATKPVSSKTDPANVNRDPVYVFVTREPADNVFNEINITIGYPFKEGSDAIVEIGSDKYDFFTQGDGAWVKNAALEGNVVASMKRGASMLVRATSSRGTLTVDTFSLSGATAAINRITQECPGG